MGGVLAVMEQRDGALKKVSYEALSAARALADQMGGSVEAVVIGPPGLSADGLGQHGADTVAVFSDDRLQLYQPDLYAAAVVSRVKSGEAEVVMLPATALGRDLGPRLSARLGCALAPDVTEIAFDDGLTVTRPVYSGKALGKVRLSGERAVISLRPNTFAVVQNEKSGMVAEAVLPEDATSKSATLRVKEPERASLDVAEASIVVSGGRGLKEPENFKLVEDLAAAFGGEAAVGASRAVVDAGWRPHSDQVGQTGKTVSPQLYIAVGISGAVQHLAGMRTSKVIVAINRDKDAPIFKVADYGLVGDLFQIIPKLTDEIAKIKQS